MKLLEKRLESVAVVACDDGRIAKFEQRKGVVACLLWHRGPLDVEAVIAPIDVPESSSLIAGLYLTLSGRSPVKPSLILLDSLTILGFSVISLPALQKLSGAPAVIIYKYEPRVENLEAPLRKHFKDWHLRIAPLRVLREARRVETRKGPLYVIPWGVSLDDAVRIIEELQHHSRIPEPLRLVHAIASELTRLVIGEES